MAKSCCDLPLTREHKKKRTEEQKCFKTYGHGLASMCPQEQKGYAVAFNAIALADSFKGGNLQTEPQTAITAYASSG